MDKIIDHFLFFSESVLDDYLILDHEQAKHAASVLRIEVGDIIFVTDGVGTIYTCKVEILEKRVGKAVIVEKKIQKKTIPHMHFYIGLPEKDAFEQALMGLVPLGVDQITPLVCSYCQKKWWLRKWDKHVERFKKKMIASAKQSWNTWLPSLNEPVEFSSVIDLINDFAIVADDKGTVLASQQSQSKNGPLSCFVGPPGGFSPEELFLLKDRDVVAVRLSDHRLRTELAATVLAGYVVNRYSADG